METKKSVLLSLSYSVCPSVRHVVHVGVGVGVNPVRVNDV